jgi:hypothetical protein
MAAAAAMVSVESAGGPFGAETRPKEKYRGVNEKRSHDSLCHCMMRHGTMPAATSYLHSTGPHD